MVLNNLFSNEQYTNAGGSADSEGSSSVITTATTRSSSSGERLKQKTNTGVSELPQSLEELLSDIRSDEEGYVIPAESTPSPSFSSGKAVEREVPQKYRYIPKRSHQQSLLRAECTLDDIIEESARQQESTSRPSRSRRRHQSGSPTYDWPYGEVSGGCGVQIPHRRMSAVRATGYAGRGRYANLNELPHGNRQAPMCGCHSEYLGCGWTGGSAITGQTSTPPTSVIIQLQQAPAMYPQPSWREAHGQYLISSAPPPLYQNQYVSESNIPQLQCNSQQYPVNSMYSAMSPQTRSPTPFYEMLPRNSSQSMAESPFTLSMSHAKMKKSNQKICSDRVRIIESIDLDSDEECVQIMNKKNSLVSCLSSFPHMYVRTYILRQ